MHLRAAGRVALLAILMLALVSSIALVGSGHRADDGSEQALALSAGSGVRGEASLLSRMLKAPDFAARAESLERLGMGDSRLDVPVAGAPGTAAQPGSWSAMGEGPGRAAAAQLQAMQLHMQVRAPAGCPRLGVTRVLCCALRLRRAHCACRCSAGKCCKYSGSRGATGASAGHCQPGNARCHAKGLAKFGGAGLDARGRGQ